jgi:RNA polymerase sigma-70 factor (ECF subfamily)
MVEKELITELKRGDEAAFQALVSSRQNLVYNTVLGFLQNQEDAEDVTQDIFIKVFESIHQFKGDSSLTTWIYRIAVTSSFEFLRRKKRKKRFGFMSPLFGDQNEQTIEIADFYHPGIALDQRENASMLFKAIKKLPENQQIAFLLNKVEGLSYQDVSKVMNTSLSAVESLIHRAKINLREILKNLYNL